MGIEGTDLIALSSLLVDMCRQAFFAEDMTALNIQLESDLQTISWGDLHQFS